MTRGFAGFAREEDVDLGLTLRLGLLAAPRLFGYDRDGIGPQFAARLGASLPSGFGYLEAAGGGVFTGGGLDSGSVQLAATAVLKPQRHQVGIVHVEAGWLKNPVPGAEFDLGLGSGPRAFRSHAFTGDRSYFATAEYRVTVVEDFLGMIGLGFAGFVDHGGAWYSGSPRRTGWDAGLGLRLGASRSTDTEALRFDLARRFGNDAQGPGWVITVGKGFVFSSLGRVPLRAGGGASYRRVQEHPGQNHGHDDDENDQQGQRQDRDPSPASGGRARETHVVLRSMVSA